MRVELICAQSPGSRLIRAGSARLLNPGDLLSASRISCSQVGNFQVSEVRTSQKGEERQVCGAGHAASECRSGPLWNIFSPVGGRKRAGHGFSIQEPSLKHSAQVSPCVVSLTCTCTASVSTRPQSAGGFSELNETTPWIPRQNWPNQPH